MKKCLKCENNIPVRIIIDGKSHSLQNRKYCIKCSPFGERNTKKLHISQKERSSPRYYQNFSESERKSYNQKLYKYQKIQRNKRKILLINEGGGCCVRCGYDKNLGSLSFHHRNPKDKKFMLSVRELFARSIEELREEAAKCDVLCNNCHSELHYPDLDNWNNEKSPILDSNQ